MRNARRATFTWRSRRTGSRAAATTCARAGRRPSTTSASSSSRCLRTRMPMSACQARRATWVHMARVHAGESGLTALAGVVATGPRRRSTVMGPRRVISSRTARPHRAGCSINGVGSPRGRPHRDKRCAADMQRGSCSKCPSSDGQLISHGYPVYGVEHAVLSSLGLESIAEPCVNLLTESCNSSSRCPSDRVRSPPSSSSPSRATKGAEPDVVLIVRS